jgi:DhnA family fructose-bisphosphate aldolase class Ia
MISKRYRMHELFNPADDRSLVVDTSGGLSLGALPGLEDYKAAVTAVLPVVDGVVASPGQSRALMSRSRSDAGLLICGDWSNAFRGEKFVLPPEHINYVPLITAADALDLGANSLVMHFLLGHEETIDAACMRRVVQLAMEGAAAGMPLVVNVHPTGPRVVLRSKAIELGVSYALEGGADGIAIPWPGGASFVDIQTMAAEVPVWVKPQTADAAAPEVDEMLTAGATNLWLDETLFATEDPVRTAEAFAGLIHEGIKVAS